MPIFPIRIQIREEEDLRVLDYAGEGPLRIGRDPGCDIVLTSRKSSRHQADVLLENGKLLLRDASSANGTLLNGIRIIEAELQPGDEVQIGDTRILFGEQAAPIARAEPVPAEASSPAPPPAALDGDEEEDEAEAREEEPISQRPFIATPRRRRRPPPSRLAAAGGGILIILAVCAGLSIFLRDSRAKLPEAGPLAGVSPTASSPGPRGAESPPGAPPSPAAGEATAMVTAGAAVIPPLSPETSPGDPPRRPDGEDAAEAGSEAQSLVPGGEPDARTSLDKLLEDAAGGKLGWEVLERLQQFLDSHPDDPALPLAAKQLAVLQGTRRGATSQAREQALRLLQKTVEEGLYGDAMTTARFLAGLAPDDGTRGFWEGKAAEYEAAARSRFRTMEEELSNLLASGKPLDALQALVSVERQFARTGFYDLLLPRYVESSAALRPKKEEPFASPAAIALKDRIQVAFDECRFAEIESLTHSLLGLTPPPEIRLQLMESLIESIYLEHMLADSLSFLAKNPVEVSVLEGYAGRVVRADRKEVEYEVDIEGRKGAYRDTKLWRNLSLASKFAIFENVLLSREGLLGLVLFGFRCGDEDGAQRALLKLFKRKETQSLANGVLASHLGVPVPDGGFVEFNGRLVTPEARLAELDRRKHAQEEDRAARAELQRLKRDNSLGSFIAMARRLRTEGLFTLAQAILTEIQRRFPDSAQGKIAQQLIEDPILHVTTLLQNGPPDNRLDLYILGDGYPAQDDYQAGFLASANTAMKLLLKEEPFKEYASYLNIFAVQLASKERGLDRMPGDVKRDTPLGGKVEWDVFTADRKKTHALLRRLGNGKSDDQAIVIGNDFAGVSTGGGGVSCVTKVSLTALAHELGHSLGGLRDEYDTTPGNDPKRASVKKREANVPVSALPPNLMAGSDREEVLRQVGWKKWLDAGDTKWWNGSKVSAFEGGNLSPFNVWRPQASCKMRDSSKFCVVCMEVMVAKIYARVRPIDGADPKEKEITLKPDAERELKVWPMKPETHFLEARWTFLKLPDETPKGPTVVVDRSKPELLRTVFRRYEPDGRVAEVALLRARDLGRGRYRVRVEVHDPTPWVLSDEQGVLKQGQEWTVLIKE